jgi:biopolymer transport protein ExbD
MALTALNSPSQPMMAINTTPLIDVMLVLLIMIIITIPVSTHSVEVALPSTTGTPITTDPVRNKVTLTRDDAVLWNGKPVSLVQLSAALKQTLDYPIEPELQFQPEPEAGYDLSARVLAVIKASKVTKFGFVGNEQFGAFDKSGGPR